MTTEQQPDNNQSNRGGKIAAAIFLLLMILPVCYAVVKEIKMAKQAKNTPAPTAKPSPSEAAK